MIPLTCRVSRGLSEERRGGKGKEERTSWAVERGEVEGRTRGRGEVNDKYGGVVFAEPCGYYRVLNSSSLADLLRERSAAECVSRITKKNEHLELPFVHDSF